MTHYAVLVIYEGDISNAEDKVDGLLDKYNVDKHRTQKTIAWTKKSIEEFRPTVMEQLNGMTEEEAMNHSIRFFRNLYPKKAEVTNMSHEEYVKLAYGLELDEEGNAIDYTNPNAKYDWYEIGGSFKGWFTLKKDKSKSVDMAYSKDIDWEATTKPFEDHKFSTPVVCTQDGWFDEKSERENWKSGYYDRFLRDLPDNAVLVIVDCHM